MTSADDTTNAERDHLKSIVLQITQRHPELIIDVVEKYRTLLSDRVRDYHKNTVAYGPFKGLRLSDDTHWGSGDHGVMVLGMYEREVLNELASISPRRRAFVNLGAGDGYYAVGMLIAGLCDRSYCFEISEKGRGIIAQTAAANNVADKVTVAGKATAETFNAIPRADLNDSVVLVDIEGWEYEIMTEQAFAALAQSVVIVELHEHIKGAPEKVERLRRAAEATHSIRRLWTARRDPSEFPELAKLNDNQRWLLCSEARPHLMSWFRFDPLT